MLFTSKLMLDLTLTRHVILSFGVELQVDDTWRPNEENLVLRRDVWSEL